MANQEPERYRKVKTVLLCKVKPDAIRKVGTQAEKASTDNASRPGYIYSDIYQSIYKGPKGDARRYISIGNVDAFSLYDTETAELPPFISPKNAENSWFSKLYQDKQNIILQTDAKINYHPIHLVSNSASPLEDDSKIADRYPFCIVTLIYGIRSPGGGEKQAAAENDDPRSVYETAISDFLRKRIPQKDKRQKKGNDPSDNTSSEKNEREDVVFEVYNAVNICDAAIIWYTRDIHETMKLSDSLTETKFARKTFTLIGFRMNDTGKIIDAAYDALEAAPASSAPETPVSAPAPYYARIQGSIRDQSVYRKILRNIGKRLPEVTIRHYLVCGQSDFTILLSELSGRQLRDLLKYLLEEDAGREIVYACWDIHTELMYKDPAAENPEAPETAEGTQRASEAGGPADSESSIKPHPRFAPVLENLFEDCRELSDSMEKYPWFGAFYELLNVHSTIDQHPILHGPSYLMYGPAKTAVYYFQEAKNGDKDVTEMLPQSLRLIQEFLRNWSDLTDQLLRIDDLVFHGFGNNSALFMTLPECALDFYHAILLEFIDLLIRADENDGRCLNNDRGPYESDFLLVPELHSGISIEPMFLADGLKNGQDLHNGATGKRILWPLKQAYLVRFPIETVYAPERFFISLIHECFHYFGDACRLRGRRTKFICAFMASSIVWYLGYVRASVQNKQLFHSIYQYLTNEFSDIPEPNRKESEKRLGSGLDKLFTTDGLNKILESAGGANQETFQRDDVLLKWYNGQFALASRCATGEFASNWGSVIADCFYYFQECYADYMTIRLLGLNVEEYLKLFEEESKSSVAVEGLMADAQRIAVVLAACTEHGIPGFDPKATEKAFAAVPDMPASFLRVIQACRAALWDRDQVFTLGKEEQPYSMAIHPTVVLSYVADYLGEVNAAFRTHFVNAPIAEDYRELKDKYDFFFRKGNFLSNKYFRVIRNNHNRVRSDARESLLKKAAASVEKPDFDAALQYLNDAINMSSDQFAGDFYTRGNACLALGRFEEAEASFRRAIELQPDFAPAYIGRGDAYCEMASFEHAIADYNKAMELQPDNPSVFQKQAAALRSLGKDLLAEQCEAKARALSGEKF